MRGVGKRFLQVPARGDAELAVRAGQVHLDRLHRNEERLCYLLVAHPFGGHPRDAALACCQCVDARSDELARASAHGGELLLGLAYERSRAGSVRELEPLADELARLCAPVASPECRAEFDERARVFEPGRRLREHVDRLAQEFFAFVSAHEAECPKRDADWSPGPPTTRELELLFRELGCVGVAAEQSQGESSLRAPRHVSGVRDADPCHELADDAKGRERLLDVAPCEEEARSGVEVERAVAGVNLLLRAGGAENPLGFFELIALDERVDEESNAIEGGRAETRRQVDLRRAQVLLGAEEVSTPERSKASQQEHRHYVHEAAAASLLRKRFVVDARCLSERVGRHQRERGRQAGRESLADEFAALERSAGKSERPFACPAVAHLVPGERSLQRSRAERRPERALADRGDPLETQLPQLRFPECALDQQRLE